MKLVKSTTETYDLLNKVYGDECLSCTQVFKWFKSFKEGWEEIGDDQRPGLLSTKKSDANIDKVGEIVRQNRLLSIRAVAELINIDNEAVRQILHNNLNTIKKTVFEDGAEEIRMNICADILQNIENHSNFLETVITCDESCFF